MAIRISELAAESLKELDIGCRGLYLSLLLIADDNGDCTIKARSFCKEIGMSYQQLRTALNRLQTTHLITRLITHSATHQSTHQSTHSATHSATHLRINNSISCDIQKNTEQRTQQRIEQRGLQRGLQRTGQRTEEANLQPDLATQRALPSQPGMEPPGMESAGGERMDWDAFARFFNERVKGTRIPQVRVMTEGRKRNVREMLRRYGKGALVKAIDNCVKTPFLRGENDRGWAVDIDWIYSEKHFVKILESNYDWQRDSEKGGASSGRSQGGGATREGVAREILRMCEGRGG